MTAAKSKIGLPGHLGRSRSTFRWQHPLKRERPTGMEPKWLIQQCGWKDGDRGGDLAKEKLGWDRAACHFLLNEGLASPPPVQASLSARYTSAWTGPGRDAGDGPYRRKWQVLNELLTPTGFLMEGPIHQRVARPPRSPVCRRFVQVDIRPDYRKLQKKGKAEACCWPRFPTRSIGGWPGRSLHDDHIDRSFT